MTITRKIAVVILTLGLLLMLRGYCVNENMRDERHKLRDEISSNPFSGELAHQWAQFVVDEKLPRIESIERLSSEEDAIGFLVAILGVVMLIIGGKREASRGDN